MSNAVKKLKCGGSKKGKKRLQEGGIPGPDKQGLASLYTTAGDIAGGFAEDLITSGIKEPSDIRVNPYSQMRRNDKLGTAGKITGNTAKGAGLGAAVGTFILPGVGTGLGAALGAGIGALGTTIKRTFMSRRKKDAAAAAEHAWDVGSAGEYADAAKLLAYKKGGIHIKPENKGKFTATKKATGKSTTELLHSKNAKTRSRANFARMAKRGFKALMEGGLVAFQDGGTKKKLILKPKGDEQFDKDLTINATWINELKKGKTIEEVLKTNIGTFKGDSISLGKFNKDFPSDVKNWYKSEFEIERNKMRLGLPNRFQKMNLSASPEDTAGYFPASNIKDAGNNVAYYKTGGLKSISKNKAAEMLKNPPHGKPLSTKQKRTFQAIEHGWKPSHVEGGKIEGKGGPKSDAIDMKAQDGSFIVPAENADKAIELGKDYLGWDGTEHAGRKYPGSEIAVSDGEVLFTPEEVSIFKYHGIDLNRLAPKAKEENKMKGGGEKKTSEYDARFADYASQYRVESPDATDEEIKKVFESSGYADILDTKVPEEEKSTLQKIFDIAPEIAGGLQIGAATYGLQKAGELPDLNVSESLKQLSAELHKESQYGLEPGVKTAMNVQAEKARRDTTNAIMQRGGGSAEIMSNLQGVLSTTIDKKYGIELADAAEKARKKTQYYGTREAISGQEFDIKKSKRADWLQQQEVNAGLLTAGISNIVGARKLKAEMDVMKKIAEANKINFNLGK
jgi:hypothetical protein